MTNAPAVLPVVRLGNLVLGAGRPPLIVAELSGNHGGSLDKARRLIELAAAAGAQAIKLQTYTADSMTMNVDGPGFRISDPSSLWCGRSLHDLYRQAATPYAWHQPLFEYADSLGLLAFSSPFDEGAVDFLEDLAVPCYKIASFELTHLPLIRRVAATGKPLILSTGMATLGEIEEAVTTARDAGARDLVLLKCSSRYPASPASADLRGMVLLQEAFGCLAGYSDHTQGLSCAVAATALGAVLIEKHLACGEGDAEVDAAFSTDGAGLKDLVRCTREAWQALGEARFGNGEDASERVYRRSLHVARDIAAGEAFTPDSLCIVRPGAGLHPRFLDVFLGGRSTSALRRGTPLQWRHLDGSEKHD